MRQKRIAYQIQDAPLISQIKIREGSVLLSFGLFKEVFDTLNSVNPVFLDDSLKCILYTTLARAYYNIADYVHDPIFRPEYISWGNTYIDSALHFL